MPTVIVVGAQWGDEGKGKIIDLLTKQANHIIRSQGGNNAGHTILIGDEEYKLHLIPSGILQPHTRCTLGAGTVIDPEVLINEIKGLEERGIEVQGRLWISPGAHVIFPYHSQIDLLQEKLKGECSIGTTGRGIGPCYADKANRIGIRMAEFVEPELFPRILNNVLSIKNLELSRLHEAPPISSEEILAEYNEYARFLRPYVADVDPDESENILLEGAQGTFLDITAGTYPFVTSSSTIAAGICAGAGIGPTRIDHTIGVIKAYTTRVGNGPLPTEVDEEENFLDHLKAREFGTTTNRKRRIGWFDAVLAQASVRLNGLDSIAVTKLDVLDSLASIKICTGYLIDGKPCEKFPALTSDLRKVVPVYETVEGWNCDTSGIREYEKLPSAAKRYLRRISDLSGVPISMISLGPERDSTIVRLNPFNTKTQRNKDALGV